MKTPKDYTSIFALCRQNRVFQYKDLCGYNRRTNSVNPIVYDNIKEIIPFTYSPRYHIIRTFHSFLHNVTIDNFHHVFHDLADYLSEPDIPDLDKLLNTPPIRTTFIFIKEKLRCAKTIPKLFLGVLYERSSLYVSHSAIIQGLAGRITGYEPNDAVVFTNIPSIHFYLHSWKHRFMLHNKKPFWASP